MSLRHLAAAIAAGLATFGAAHAATLSGSFTADDELTIYLSDDLVADPGELLYAKTSLWPATESFAGITLSSSRPQYLLVKASNTYGGPAMFIADFAITGPGPRFANGSSLLSTDTTHWTAGETGFAGATAAPTSMGTNQTLPIWGPRPGISGTATALWTYNADWANGHTGDAYFVTQISAVPEPTMALLLAAGLAAVGTAARRRRRG